MRFHLVHLLLITLGASAALTALPGAERPAAQVPDQPEALCPTPNPRASAATHLDDGAWSYFGDPRALAHRNRVFVGCVSRRGEVVIHQVDRKTGRTAKVIVHRNPEVDDHDNPSLVFWRGQMWAFYSPHSGRYYPLNRTSEMHYRASQRPYNIKAGFGPEHHVRTNTRGGLGYTYPNAVANGDKLWLFWRGGNWYPTFSYTKDGKHWVPARTLVVGPHGQRPYAKYVGGGDGSIHMVMSEAHVQSKRTSLYYVRYKAGRFYRANGRRIGTMRDLPLRISQIDRIYAFNAARGRAWPHDIALDAGRPVVLYTPAASAAAAGGTRSTWLAGTSAGGSTTGSSRPERARRRSTAAARRSTTRTRRGWCSAGGSASGSRSSGSRSSCGAPPTADGVG